MAAEPTENGATTTTTTLATDVKVESDTPASDTVVPATAAVAAADETPAPAKTTVAEKKWPGWPGQCVFRLVIQVLKVGSIIGKKGELIKKLCEETRARVRVLEGVHATTDRIVLISGKEEPEAPLSPAMDAVLRVFKRINGLTETEGESAASSSAAVATTSIKLLVATSQAVNLIGKQGSLIKSIQDSTGANVHVLSSGDLPHYATSEERVVEISGEALKVYKALEAVIGHLRKFLVDQSVIAMFEKNPNATASKEQPVDSWADKSQSLQTALKTGITSDYQPSFKRESLYLDRESQLDSQMQPSSVSLYGQDPALSGLRSGPTRDGFGRDGFGREGLGREGLGREGLGRAATIVTQVTQTMQIPLSFAEDIIGLQGANIGFIRRSSGAILTVQESVVPDEIVVEIKGTSQQVNTAQQLIHDFINTHKEPVASNYGKMDLGLRSSYSQPGNTSYPSTSLSTQSHGGYGSSSVGGYSSFRY